MAKFTKTYDIKIGQIVIFMYFDGKPRSGTVQDISELPDLYVETGFPGSEDYNRYRISVDMIRFNKSDSFWKDDTETTFEDNEFVSFEYDDHLRVYTRRDGTKVREDGTVVQED